jgi:(p)ppGpp synthase/HD superfamily hydrolase
MSLETILTRYQAYDAHPDLKLVERAYHFAEAAHLREKRFGKFDFLEHPLAVALLLTEAEAEGELLAAALLHDVLEHTDFERGDLADEFGEPLSSLVDGVTVLLTSSRKEDFQKLFLAASRDLRVPLLRIAEEIDNLANFEHFSPGEQEEMREKVIKIYLPLASLLKSTSFKKKLLGLVSPGKKGEASRKGKEADLGRKIARSALSPEEKLSILRELISWGEERGFAKGRVLAFTPKGDVIDLPKGATPLDFAFAVHTGVGGSCTGAKAEGKMVPLDYQLKSGETVEIVTSKGREPSPDWLEFVKTDLARSQIKKALKK